jgi:hypothetical protein
MRIGAIKILSATAALTMMAVGAQAQMAGGSPGGSRQPFGNHSTGPKDPPKAKADDKAYTSALKGLPNKPYDPWHGIH